MSRTIHHGCRSLTGITAPGSRPVTRRSPRAVSRISPDESAGVSSFRRARLLPDTSTRLLCVDRCWAVEWYAALPLPARVRDTQKRNEDDENLRIAVMLNRASEISVELPPPFEKGSGIEPQSATSARTGESGAWQLPPCRRLFVSQAPDKAAEPDLNQAARTVSRNLSTSVRSPSDCCDSSDDADRTCAAAVPVSPAVRVTLVMLLDTSPVPRAA